MSKEILQDIINDFSPEKFSRFFRDKSRLFSPRQEAVGHYDDESFKHGLKLGEIKFSETEKLIVCSFQVKQSLSERSGKKAQYEKGKKILKDAQSDAGIFIFYDQTGNFRFSLIYPETIGNRRQWSSFRRFTYFVSREFTNRTFLQQIGDSELSSIEKIKYAFNVEKVTKEFYLEYRKLFESLVKDFSSNHTFINEAAKNDINTENFAKKLLGQIVFIYFIQKKGWMGVSAGQNWGSGDKNFLVNIFKEAISKKENFFNDYLEPLFYGTLNNPRRNTADPSFSKDFDCRIPFLNGGLFEAEYDWKNSFIYLDNNIFKSIFDVFERFNFTVEEESPDDKEIAVDPEMLGKVFENLLPENLRKGTGTYYTPREIVYYMCQESLVNYLDSNSRLGKDKIEKCVKSLKEGGKLITDKEAVELDNLLGTIKICDPACGSGAFLVGMLNEIVRLRLLLRVLCPSKLSKKSEYQLKKDTIHNCIYGVDIDPGAIEIAKLRLWLALVVDYEIKEIEPLPNLDYRLMCGNSLLEEFEGVRFYNGDDEKQDLELFKDTKKQEKIAELKKKVEEYFDIYDDEEKRSKRKEINDIKDWLVKTALEKRRKELASHRKSEEAKLNMFNEESRKKYFENWGTKFLAEAKINEVLRNLHDPRKAKPFFIWKLEFIDVFEDKGGFDVVIANPPYISHDKIKEKNGLKSAYASYEPFADLYCYFLENALNLQGIKGLLCYITSNSYLRADYGYSLREIIRSENIITQIINIEDFQVFDSAIVNTAVLMSQKRNGNDSTQCLIVNTKYLGDINFQEFVDRNKFYYSQKDFCSKSWTLVSKEKLKLKNKIEEKGKSLERYGTKIRLGLATGSNEAFVISEDMKNALIQKDRKNKDLIKPILRGRNIFRYRYKLPGFYIILSKNGINVKKEYPEIYKYFDSFGQDFKKRGAKGEHWSNLRACAFFDDFKKEKIIWIELTDKGRFALCSEEIYLLNSAYFLLPPEQFSAKYLLGILNSTLIEFYLNSIAETSGMGTNRWINNYIKEFPIPEISKKEQEPLIELVDNTLTFVNNDKDYLKDQKQIKQYEREIDQMVYKLYGLTKEEVEIVENSLS